MTMSLGRPGPTDRNFFSPTLSVVVPTRNEAGNVETLVDGIADAVDCEGTEIIFVDDSIDDTPAVIESAVECHRLPIRLIHRAVGVGGLSGAVVDGLRASRADWCVVMDGDLQHPPSLIPALVARGEASGADVVVASRHLGGGSGDGLDGWMRRGVSMVSTLLTRGMFPLRLRDCTDPMSGYFAVRRDRLDLERLRPRGFKILLEILSQHRFVVAEEPFVFGTRGAGESKAAFAQGAQFVIQLAALRFGRLSLFAAIGAFGTVVNLALMAALVSIGVWFVAAALTSGVLTIIMNFALQERFVFADMRREARGIWGRFARSFGFNAIETAIRTALLWAIVAYTVLPSVVTQAALLALAFLARFAYQSLVVYRPRHSAPQVMATDGRLHEVPTDRP